ncbi:MAG: hypothetical protein H7336_02630 [Bacteriovorax sp.]|nr:hypothetical protein [Bacteriovorax sp.]
MDKDKILENYNRDGYVLLKNVFSPEEIRSIREKITNLSSLEGDVLSHESLREVLLDERVLEPLRIILKGKLVYFGDSCVQSEKKEGTRGFHRDSKEDFEDPTKTDYPIVRLGIYTQDHVQHGGGLKVRQGSYKREYFGKQNISRALFGKPYGPLSWKALRIGKSINLDIAPGDLIIWNLRTWHSGHAVRLKFFRRFSINPKLEKHIPKSFLRPSILPRMVIFSSFGVSSKELDTYVAERAKHPSNAEFWKKCKFDSPEVELLCLQKGIELKYDGIKK